MTRILLAFALGTATVLAAQQPSSTPPPAAPQAPVTFRAGIDLVNLDVSVLDRDRHPVRGLTAADFTVLENGRPQRVEVFSAVDVPAPLAVTAPWMRDVAPDVVANTPRDRRLVAILMDDAAMQADLRAIANAKAIARRVIDSLGPGDLATVVFTQDNRGAQELTTDRARLLAAVDKFNFSFRDMGGTENDLAFRYSSGVLDDLIKVLGDAPERRKLVVYVGQGIPFDPVLASAPSVPGGSMRANLTQDAVSQTLRAAIEKAERANVTVYTADACGLRAPPAVTTPSAQTIGGGGGLATIAPPATSAPGFPPTCQPGREIEYLQTVAENTGGRALINRNDVADQVPLIFEENSSYYLMGYRTTNAETDGKFRRIEVKVDQPGLDVRTRNGYDAPKAAKPPKPGAPQPSPLVKALSGILPLPDIALQVHTAAFVDPKASKPRVAIVLGVRQTDLASAKTRVMEAMDLQVSAFDHEGRPRGYERQTARVAVRAGADGDVQYEVLTGFSLEPGRYNLRLAAHSTRQDKSGSVYVAVDVPDFGKAPLSLSGVELAATPSPAAAPRDALAALMPIIPTSRREFDAIDEVQAFVRVYQGGRGPLVPVSCTLRIDDDHGQHVLEAPQTFGADRFGRTRATDVLVDIPIAHLAPGSYLLAIEARAGKTTVARDVRFVRR